MLNLFEIIKSNPGNDTYIVKNTRGTRVRMIINRFYTCLSDELHISIIKLLGYFLSE